MPRRGKSTRAPIKSKKKAPRATSSRVKKGSALNIRELKAKQSAERKALKARQSAELKEFRKKAAAIKRAGLAFRKTPVNGLRPTGYRRKIIKLFEDITTGTAKAHKVPRKAAQFFKQAGERVAHSRIVLKEMPNAKTFVRNGRLITKERIGDHEETREYVPVKAEDIEDFLENIRHDKKFQKKEQDIGFEFFGYRTRRTFRRIDDAIRQLRTYLENRKFNEMSPEDQSEILRNVYFRSAKRGSWDAIQHNQALSKKRRKAERRDFLKRHRVSYRTILKRDALGGNKRSIRAYVEVKKKDRIKKEKDRASKRGRKKYNDYMRNYMRKKRGK